jgi:hypothetical protein
MLLAQIRRLRRTQGSSMPELPYPLAVSLQRRLTEIWTVDTAL